MQSFDCMTSSRFLSFPVVRVAATFSSRKRGFCSLPLPDRANLHTRKPRLDCGSTGYGWSAAECVGPISKRHAAERICRVGELTFDG